MQSIIVIVFGIVIVSFVEANPIVGQNKTDKGFITIIDQIINLGSVPKCATGQGQPGYCTIGTCPNLGNFSSVGCTGRNRFIKCCPNEVAFERYPLGKKECGIRPDRPDGLIVGGLEATPHSWPWAAALYRIHDQRKFFQCGATIISERYILTAAHCVFQKADLITDPNEYVVKVGAHELSDSGEFMQLDSITIHENYTPQYHNDDIALLRLKRPLDFVGNDRIAPVCLPERGSRLGRKIGTMATMIGWGVHDQMDFTPSDTLYQVNVPISSLEKCRDTYNRLLNMNYYFDWNNVICASESNGGHDTCQGDSGGPMLISKSNGRYYQTGVVSFGYGCAEKGYPGVYTYVPNYLAWIGAHMH
ncbi:trypsin-1 [Dermatophagoides pteronyssinus]|uniref:limulus clotting factor C n=2 Tax=Dermatophagoides pteronyssinus TaxID=6956 RepID=A0A6P6XTR0_DERPT|nr:clotting factor B-like [Dermatophagoides pteronyssinus]